MEFLLAEISPHLQQGSVNTLPGAGESSPTSIGKRDLEGTSF
jgi:hypothetical protein